MQSEGILMLTVTIATDNAAFEDHAGEELARILHKLADTVEQTVRIAPNGGEWINEAHLILDANGNTVGRWSLSTEGSA
jgi:hypothetical protein